MTTDRCEEMRLLLQADLDGELDVAGTASVAAHLAHCSQCAAAQVAVADLSARLRTEIAYHAAPDSLRQSIRAALAAAAPSPPVRKFPISLAGGWRGRLLPFGAGLAVAAMLALAVLPRSGGVADEVVASHIRALQPGHAMDVVSTDQHTVKPWFDGRLDYAPPVRDFAAKGFPLVGGRLDYVAGRPVAALVYHRALHLIDVYVWPSAQGLDAAPASAARSGYNVLRWQQDGMMFWAVSDLNAAELGTFAALWHSAA